MEQPSHRLPGWQPNSTPCRKRSRPSPGPGLHMNVISDPELSEYPAKRHVSECMASDLNRHMSLASCSSDDPSTSDGLLGPSRAPTPPGMMRPLSVTGIRQTSSQGARPTHSETQLGEAGCSEQGWQPTAMSESLSQPSTSGITGDVTFPVRSPGSSMGGATSHAAQSDPPTPHLGVGINNPWFHSPRHSHGGAPLCSPASDAGGQLGGSGHDTRGSGAPSPVVQAPKLLAPSPIQQVSDALLQSLSPGAMLPPPSPGTSSDSSNAAGKPRPNMLRPTPTQMQMQDLMPPPSPSDARFMFTDLRKAALLRSFKQRTEDSCAMQIASEGLPPQDTITVAADTASGMQAALLGRETVPTLATQLEIKLPGALMPPGALALHTTILPAEPALASSTVRVPPDLVLTQLHPSSAADSPPIAAPPLTTSPPPLPARTSFSGCWGGAGQLQVVTSHSLPPFRPRGSSPIARADSFMETINSMEGSSSSGSDEDAEVEQQMRRSQPVVLGPAGIAPLPTSFLGFPDPSILHRHHQRSAGGAGPPGTLVSLLPGTSPPDNLMLGPLVGTPAPHFSMGAHMANMRAAPVAGNKLMVVPECVDKEMSQ